MQGTKKCKYCKTEIDKSAKICPNCNKKQGGKLKFIILAVILIGIFSAAINGGNDTSDKTDPSSGKKDTTITNDENSNTVKEDDAAGSTEESKEQEAAAEPFETTLSAGHYTAGIDFPSGNYDITAVDGSGNVSSSNMFSGGLNEVMATKEDDMYIKEFKNADLKKDTVLSIGGNLSVKISSKEADTAGLTSRSNELTKEVELSSGNYVTGADFPAGIYDVILVKGSGNVSSSNMYDGGLNEIMGSGDDMYIKEFKHASFSDGDTLELSGVTVKLVPSK